MLLLVRESGRLRFFTHAARPEPRAGDTIITFAPVKMKTPQDVAAKRAGKDAAKAEEAKTPASDRPKPQAT
jgi:hypothetical protein